MPQLTWLVTGCTSGLGEVFIQSILARGDKAIATSRGAPSRLSNFVEAGAKTYSLDVTASQAEINSIVAQIISENGSIDVLVNNAGYIEAGSAEETSIENYVAQFETNFFGIVKATKAILPHFRARKSGTIVFVGSMGGIAGEPAAGPYCASKFALEGWHDVLRQETASLGIKSIIFEPGFFRTKIFHPNNAKVFRSEQIPDYDGMRDVVIQTMKAIDGTQAGDPKKAVEIMLDVVKGEDVAEGREMPERLPLGPDGLAKMRERCEANLAICKSWGDVVGNTNVDE